LQTSPLSIINVPHLHATVATVEPSFLLAVLQSAIGAIAFWEFVFDTSHV
jgi:hypothetical protein